MSGKNHLSRLLLPTGAAAIVIIGSFVMFDLPGSGASEPQRNDLATMDTVALRLGQETFDLWVARTPDQRELGLMWVEPGQMADNQGMLFAFEHDQATGFWMRNTLIPLDIAFVRDDGTVVGIRQMQPRSLALHGPDEPYRYAIETNAGALGRARLQVGDIVRIPANLLNP